MLCSIWRKHVWSAKGPTNSRRICNGPGNMVSISFACWRHDPCHIVCQRDSQLSQSTTTMFKLSTTYISHFQCFMHWLPICSFVKAIKQCLQWFLGSADGLVYLVLTFNSSICSHTTSELVAGICPSPLFSARKEFTVKIVFGWWKVCCKL